MTLQRCMLEKSSANSAVTGKARVLKEVERKWTVKRERIDSKYILALLL